jgi:hypothetical protein
MPWALKSQEGTPVPNEQEAGWAPEPVSLFWTIKKFLGPAMFLAPPLTLKRAKKIRQ